MTDWSAVHEQHSPLDGRWSAVSAWGSQNGAVRLRSCSKTHPQRYMTCTHEELTARRGNKQNSCAGAAHVVGVHLGPRKLHIDLGNGTAVDSSEDCLEWGLNMPQYVLLSHTAQADCSDVMAGIALMIPCPRHFLKIHFSSSKKRKRC